MNWVVGGDGSLNKRDIEINYDEESNQGDSNNDHDNDKDDSDYDPGENI